MSDEIQNMSSEQLNTEIGRLESTIGGSNDAPAEKPTIFDHGQDKALTNSLSKIYDASEKREERRPSMPTREGEKLGDRVERAYEWQNLSAAERKLQSDASSDVAALKDTAAKYNLTLQEAKLVKQSELAKSATEWGPAADHLRSAFKDTPVAESARFFADTKRALDTDFVGTIGWMAQQYNVHPMQLAQEIAQRYGHQQAQPQSNEAAYNAMAQAIERVSHTLPKFGDYEQDMFEIIGKGQIKRTNDPIADLKSAYREAVKRDAKLTDDDRMKKEMGRIYDRKSGAK